MQYTRNSESRNGRTGIARGVTAALLLAGASGSFAAADCDMPEKPVMPDGATASLEQMIEGQQAVKTFQTANMDYMKCLETYFEAAKAEAESATGDAAKSAARKEHSETVDLYNDAVSTEEEVAGAFNVELREYRAANQ